MSGINCLTPNAYNKTNQVTKITDFFYYITEHVFTYDTLGRLANEVQLVYENDTSQILRKTSIDYDTLGHKKYENRLSYQSKEEILKVPQYQVEFFYKNEYDHFRNLVQQKVFRRENQERLSPHYMITIDLTYYDN